jgi:hypothetical protein
VEAEVKGWKEKVEILGMAWKVYYATSVKGKIEG